MNYIMIVYEKKGRKYFRLFALKGSDRNRAIRQAEKEFKQDFGVKGEIIERRI
jgi:hypothetical protein